jgi:hypothetical protein
MESSEEHKSSKILSIQSAEATSSKSEKALKKTSGFFSKFKSKISSFGPGPIHQQETNNCVEKVKTIF